MPRMMSTDRVRAYLDMDAGEARFALFRPDEPGQWKEMPGKITDIKGSVCAAACMQDRCTVSLGESSKMSAADLAAEAAGGEDKVAKRIKVDKYAHVQSKFLSDSRLNPINNMLRQLGEEMRARRGANPDVPPPPHVQLSTISLVDGALPPAPHTGMYALISIHSVSSCMDTHIFSMYSAHMSTQVYKHIHHIQVTYSAKMRTLVHVQAQTTWHAPRTRQCRSTRQSATLRRCSWGAMHCITCSKRDLCRGRPRAGSCAQAQPRQHQQCTRQARSTNNSRNI